MASPKPDNVNVNVNVKKAGRKRRTLGWTLLALGVLVMGVWVVSAIATPRAGTRTVRAAVHRGILYAFVSNSSYHSPSLRGGRHVLLSDEVWDGIDQDPRGLELFHIDPGLRTRVHACSSYTLPGPLIVPLWPVGLGLLAAGPALIWFANRAELRARQGHCPACGYSLTGLAPATPCPECGENA